ALNVRRTNERRKCHEGAVRPRLGLQASESPNGRFGYPSTTGRCGRRRPASDKLAYATQPHLTTARGIPITQVAAIAKLTAVEGKGEELTAAIAHLVVQVQDGEPGTLVYAAAQDT